jgi:hypothetical protein
MSMVDPSRRLDEAQTEILQTMRDLVAHTDDTVWLSDTETVMERLAYLFEVVGGDRRVLMAEWPEYFDA